MKTKLWKIRNKETGQFSKGGSNDERWIWTKNGKTWSNIGHVKNHIRTFMDGDKLRSNYPYHNAELVEIEVDYTECFTQDVDSFVNEWTKKDKA